MRNSCLTGNFLIPEVPLNAYNFHFYSNHCIDAYWPVDDSNYNNMFAPESQIFVVWWRRSKYSSADDSCANVLWCLLLLVHTSNWNPVLDISSFSITLLLILVVVNQRLPAHRADCLPVHEIDDSMGWYLDTFLLGGAIMQLILGKLHLASHFSTQATWAAWSLEALQPGSTNFRQKSVNYLAGRSSNHSLLTRMRSEPALQARRARDRWGRRPSGCPPPPAAGAPGAPFSSGPAKSQDNLTFNIWKGDQGMYFGTLTSSEDIGLTDIPPSSSWKLTLRFSNIE